MQDIIDTLAEFSTRRSRLEIIFHHLMGHAPEVLTGLVAVTKTRPLVWVHDFFTLCPSYALMRNDVKFCGAPSVTSAACSICIFCPDRIGHLPRIQAFFDATKPIVIAPSEVTLEFWRQRSGLPHAASTVIAPARLVLVEDVHDLLIRIPGVGSPLRVAHLGGRHIFKGWSVFEELALRLADDPRYAFFHLGSDSGVPTSSRIHHVPVHVTPDRPEAMIEAIAHNRIDVVISWSLCQETFCFTVHEALAAGAFVIARLQSGNVWPAIQANAPQQGCALENEEQLSDLFTSGAIIQRVAAVKRCRGALLPTGATADWVLRRQTILDAELLEETEIPPSSLHENELMVSSSD